MEFYLSDTISNLSLRQLPVDSVSNHVKPYWPTEATTASDSEDPGGAERLRVETKVNVELHPENKLNHIGERDRETPIERDKQTTSNSKDGTTTGQPNSNSNSNHQPEQRKGERGEFDFHLNLTE